MLLPSWRPISADTRGSVPVSARSKLTRFAWCSAGACEPSSAGACLVDKNLLREGSCEVFSERSKRVGSESGILSRVFTIEVQSGNFKPGMGHHWIMHWVYSKLDGALNARESESGSQYQSFGQAG